MAAVMERATRSRGSGSENAARYSLDGGTKSGPPGLVEISVSVRMRSGTANATSWLIIPPIDTPSR